MNIQMEGEIPKYKVIFLGDQGVGKSCIINRFVQDRYEPNYQVLLYNKLGNNRNGFSFKKCEN
jgi:GTPase SAR1 family protein